MRSKMLAGAGILTLFDSFITGGTTIIAMILVVDWRLTLIAILPMPLLAVMARKLGTRLHAAFSESQAAFFAVGMINPRKCQWHQGH